jgi:hypothetical protein
MALIRIDVHHLIPRVSPHPRYHHCACASWPFIFFRWPITRHVFVDTSVKNWNNNHIIGAILHCQQYTVSLNHITMAATTQIKYKSFFNTFFTTVGRNKFSRQYYCNANGDTKIFLHVCMHVVPQKSHWISLQSAPLLINVFYIYIRADLRAFKAKSPN